MMNYGTVPPPPPQLSHVHPLHDHCSIGRGLVGLSDILFEQVPAHRIVLCQSGKLKHYFMEHPDVRELDLKMLGLSCDECGLDRSCVDMALDFVYGSNKLGTILKEEDMIVSLFTWLLKLEFYSTLSSACNSIDPNVNIAVYFKVYGELLSVPTFGCSGWDSTLLFEVQTTFENEITKKLKISHGLIPSVGEGIRQFEFAQLVSIIERVFCKSLEFSEMAQIICLWAEGNGERTQSIGELLLICEQSKNGYIPPPPITVTVRPPVPAGRRPPTNNTFYNTMPFHPPSSLRYEVDDSDESDVDDWD